MALSKEQVREIAFANYDYFIGFAKKGFGYLSGKGVPPEEIVNEAIISILDASCPFCDSVELISFVERSIKTIGYEEKSLLQDHNFVTKKNSEGEEYSILDSGTNNVIGPTAEFLRIYKIFELARFGRKNQKRTCNKCGAKAFYEMKNQFDFVRGSRLKCKACGYKMSIQARTYIHCMKIQYSQLYKLLKLTISPNPMSSHKIAKRCKMSQKSTWLRMHLIKSTAHHIESRRPSKILYRMLVNAPLDFDPIKPVETNRHMRKLSQEDAINVHRMLKDKVYPAKKIAEMYAIDVSQVYKIGRGEIYKDYIFGIPKMELKRKYVHTWMKDSVQKNIGTA